MGLLVDICFEINAALPILEILFFNFIMMTSSNETKKSALLAICPGNSPVTDEFPALRPVTRIFDIFFVLCPKYGWVNNSDAGDLRRYRAYYDVTVMIYRQKSIKKLIHEASGSLQLMCYCTRTN